MNMNGIDKERLLAFLGFGNPRAQVVFVGMEEGLQREGDLLAELRQRSKYKQFMDLYETRGSGGDARFFEGKLLLQKTWGPMCRVMLAREDKNQSPSLDEVKHYQATRLGRATGSTLLLEVLPLPASSTKDNDWPYRDIFPEFHSRKEYESEVMPRRLELLRGHIAAFERQLIICYGKGRWPQFKSLFPSSYWATTGAFEIGAKRGAKVILSPHFVSRAMNGRVAELVALAT
jgi:hypothetical protein